MINERLNEKGWNLAKLAEESHYSKSTISRILNPRYGGPNYRPLYQTIAAIATALRLSHDERHKLYAVAFPEYRIIEDAIDSGASVCQVDEILYDNGLPLLSQTK